MTRVQHNHLQVNLSKKGNGEAEQDPNLPCSASNV